MVNFNYKVYFSKLLSEKKILQVSDKKETVEEKKAEADDAPSVEENTETEEKPVSKKSSKSAKAE